MSPGKATLLNKVAQTKEREERRALAMARPDIYALHCLSKLLRMPIRIDARLFFDRSMACTLPDIVGLRLAINAIFERDFTAALIRILERGDSFIDVGAHLGYFSLLASTLVGEYGLVVAFEPTPRTHVAAGRNLAPLVNTRLYNRAVWSHVTTLDLYDFGWHRAAFNSVGRSRLGSHTQVHSVEAIDLDGFFQKMKMAPHFIKIDAEGAEWEILMGMQRTLSGGEAVLSVEVGDHMSSSKPSQEVLRHLMDHGYRCFEIGAAGRLEPHGLRSQYRYGNIIAGHPRSARFGSLIEACGEGAER